METIDELAIRLKAIDKEQRNILLRRLFDDPEIRKDLVDLAAVLQAEAEEGEPVRLDEFLSGKRTYAGE